MHRCLPKCWGSQKLGHHVNKSQHRWMWTVLLPLKESSGKHFSRSALRHTCGAKVCGRLLPLREHGTQEIKREASTSYQDRDLGSGKGKKKSVTAKATVRKKVNLVRQRWSHPTPRKLIRRSSKFRRIQCTIRKKLFLLERGSGMTFLPKKSFKGAEISILVMRLRTSL